MTGTGLEFTIHGETRGDLHLLPHRFAFVTSPHPGLVLVLHDAPDGAILAACTVPDYRKHLAARGLRPVEVKEALWRLPRYRELRFSNGVQAPQTVAVGEVRAPFAADGLSLSASGLLKLFAIFTDRRKARADTWAILGRFLQEQNRSDAFRFFQAAVQTAQGNARYGQDARYTMREIARLDPAAIQMLQGWPT